MQIQGRQHRLYSCTYRSKGVLKSHSEEAYGGQASGKGGATLGVLPFFEKHIGSLPKVQALANLIAP